MDIQKVEEAFNLIIENTQTLEQELHTHFYDALIEQNVAYVEGKSSNEMVEKNNEKLHSLNLSQQEWQKAFQFVLIKGGQFAKLQANHQFTPDSIAYIINFIIDTLKPQKDISIVELGSGTGNMASTLLSNSDKNISYTGIEVDDLLIDLAASIADVIKLKVEFMQQDAVKPLLIEPSDVVISDLPIGFYPDDEEANNFHVATDKDEHTYAHHLLMEQALNYLKDDGIAIFLAPVDLLTSGQADELKGWMKDSAHLSALIALPQNLFKNSPKAIFVFDKKITNEPTFVYNLSSLTETEIVQQFMAEFTKNVL
ncbi:DNA methyltransferase [Floricoccus tropicus]|uniref:DNA methyltransferase n=1 Tax=Floricoccus tropicus TaxID=1859473 RepID=A0A1E8GKE6_9LACT|nr:class I SAM-dependent methyltransferase [Floricoccus tropicus]OFI48714.1 DNA methyltransferase [Floricoccus tropicus]